MGVIKNLIGMKFERLLVIKYLGLNNDLHKKAMWLCKCDCGNLVETNTAMLMSGNTKSCGCYKKDLHLLTFKKYNTYDLKSKDYGIGYSSNTNIEFYFDKEDYDIIKEFCWHETNNGYIIAQIIFEEKKKLLHRFIMNAKDEDILDHINRNRRDCRKMNLRFVTYSENGINKGIQSNNTSGITGVILEKGKWFSKLNKDGIIYRLGRYDNLEDAIVARLKGELKYFGSEFAPQRHLFKEYGIE